MNNRKNQKERVAVYVDGNNFHGYLKDKQINLKKGVKFNFKKFANFLAKGRDVFSKRYYVGIARNIDGSKKSESIVRGQQKFLAYLENDDFIIKRGKVMYDGGKIREKGTDVKIAVDLMVGAVDDLYDTAVLVSSDTDIIPAIKYVRYKGKKVEYIGFSHNPSLGIQKNVDFSILLTPSDIEKFKEK